MVTVTESAAGKIKTMIEDQGDTDLGLRMMVAGGGCSGFQYKLAFDKETGENDQVIEQNGVKVLIDTKSAIYLGAGFKVNNPNAKSTCGCGESFQV